jgi:hypothetical protein
MNKYEQLIEFILNEQEDKASALFHEIVVETSRGIYENLIDEDDLSEVGGNQVDDLVDEVTMDEQGMAEGDDEEIELDVGGDEFGGDDMGGDHHADVGGDEGLEDRVMDLEDALDELKSEFDALMGDQAGGDEFGGDDMGGEEELDIDGGDDMGGDDFGADEMMEAEDDEEDDEEDLEESRQRTASGRKMTEAEWIREYVEKMGDVYQQQPAKGEGKEVGNGGSATVAAKSIVAGKNDMGGTTANIAKGGTENDPDNKPVPTPNNQYTKGKGNLPGAGQFKNVPGAKGDSFKSKAPAAKKGEQGGTNDKSPLAK